MSAAAPARWETLRARDGSAPPNADPARFHATARAMGEEEWVREAGERGVIVARRSRRRLACRVGYVRWSTPRLRCIDVVYGGLMGEGSGWEGEVVGALREELEGGRADAVMVNHVRAGSALHSALERAGAFGGALEAHWRIALTAGSFEKTMSAHSSKHRSNLRRLDRRLAEHFGGDLRLRVFREVGEVGEYLALASAIRAKTYHAAIGAGIDDTPVWRAVFGEEARLGRFRSYALYGAGEPVAYQAGTVHGSVFHAEGTGYLPELGEFRPGTVMLMRALEDLCGAGVEAVDFGFGDAEYKRTYGTEHWEEQTMWLFGATARARVARAMWSASRRGAAAAERIGGGERGLADTVKRRWRRALAQRGAKEEGR